MLERILMFALGLLAAGTVSYFTFERRVHDLEAQIVKVPTKEAVVGAVLQELAPGKVDDLVSDYEKQNDSDRLVVISGGCNASAPKDINVFVGETREAMPKQLAASVSGVERLYINVLVPPRSYYKVVYPPSSVASCLFQAWPI